MSLSDRRSSAFTRLLKVVFNINTSLVYTGAMSDTLETVLTNIAGPLVAADNASLYIVTASPEAVHLHLGGQYHGCPGNAFVERALLAPLVRDVYPRATLTVTSGLPVPEKAKRI